MPINVPPLDDRAYADILRDALARIPVHNPEWTNFNDSDPGVTLLQLFAFMTESILYRANQIPDRHRRKFLQLLGIPLVPAAAAQGFVTIMNERGALSTTTLEAGLDVRAGQVRFLTTQGLDVLPITTQLFYKRAIAPTSEQATLYQQLYADLLGTGPAAFYETTPMPPPTAEGTLPLLDLAMTVDGCLWMALLARTPTELAEVRSHLGGKTLTVGVMPRLDEEGVRIAAGQRDRAQTETPVYWEIADASTDVAKYRLLESRSPTAILSQPGLVELTLPATPAQLTSWNFALLEPGVEGTGEYPPSLADTNLSDRLITWIRLRVDKPSTTLASTSLKARLSWVGINATQVQQRVPVTGEVLGQGTGEPDQRFRLTNTPVLPHTLTLTVGGELWQAIDDLLTADAEVPVANPRLPLYADELPPAPAPMGAPTSRTQVFTLDPESGEITFGDGAHGARPQADQRIVASYAFGGGKQGNVGIGAINRSPQLPAGFKVHNPIRTWGGDDAQDVASAEKGLSRYVQHRDRLVSVPDFEDITRQTPGIDLGRVAVLPLFHPKYPNPDNPTGPLLGPLLDLAGAVTVLVIPAHPAVTTYPQPDQFFLEAVCTHLQPRRLVTTELHVRGPEYVDIWVSVGIDILGGYATGPVREAVKQELYRFLSPLYGGQVPKGQTLGTGWPLSAPVSQGELEAVVARVEGVRQVNGSLLLGTTTTDDLPKVELVGLELPRLAGVSVVSGPATPLANLRQAPNVAQPPADGSAWIPIPVLPERC